MKAAVTLAPREVEVQEAPDPVAAEGEALVRPSAVGLCGSDVHFYLGHHPYARYPQIQGHEVAGVVKSLPTDYQGPCKVGDEVVVEPLRACGACFPCRRGRRNCCVRLEVLGVHAPGALAELVRVPADSLFAADGLPADLAALCEPTSIGLQAVTRSGAQPGDQVLIVGAGAIGLLAGTAALDRGCEVMIADRLPNRLEFGRALGMTAVSTTNGGLDSELMSWTNGDGAAVVIEATGVPALVRQSIDLVAPSGTIVVVGLSEQELSVPVIEFTRKELNVLGSRNNSELFGGAVDLVRRWAPGLGQLVTHRFPLDDAPDALRFVADHAGDAGKVLVVNEEVTG
jgi:L-gulonate 5-dehydrogenase